MGKGEGGGVDLEQGVDHGLRYNRCAREDGLSIHPIAVQRCRILHERNRAPHVASACKHERVQSTIAESHALLFRYVLQPRRHGCRRKRRKAEFCAAGGDGVNDAADVVAHDAEARDAGMLLHCAPQRALCVRRHAVRLIKNDDLQGWARKSGGQATDSKLGKNFDFFSHDVNAALVARVQLQHAILDDGAEHLPHHGRDGRGFARTWRPVKEQVWEIARLQSVF